VATKDSALWAVTLAAGRRVAMRRGTSGRVLVVALLLGVLVAGVLAAVAAVTGPSYHFTSVAIPHEATTELTGISNSGDYTGLACDDTCKAPVFLGAGSSTGSSAAQGAR
jgi:hypothetical protein